MQFCVSGYLSTFVFFTICTHSCDNLPKWKLIQSQRTTGTINITHGSCKRRVVRIQWVWKWHIDLASLFGDRLKPLSMVISYVSSLIWGHTDVGSTETCWVWCSNTSMGKNTAIRRAALSAEIPSGCWAGWFPLEYLQNVQLQVKNMLLLPVGMNVSVCLSLCWEALLARGYSLA